MHKISIIIPVYNVAQYLPQCLDTVINQTYQNLEIILVNDGSTDSCPQICDEYASNDARIKIIQKENGGLSDARNAGLKIATGDFISFVDSDDVLDLSFCQTLLKTALDHDADIVECDFMHFDTDLELKKNTTVLEGNTEIFRTEVGMELLMKEYIRQMVWNKLYSREVLGDVKFPIGKINEDEFWTYKVFGNSKKMVKISDVLYFYRQQPESIMGKRYSLKRLDGLRALEERIAYMRDYFPKLENLAIKIYCFGAIFHYQQIDNNPDLDPQYTHRKQIIKSIEKYHQWSVIKKWSWKDIVWYKLFNWTPKFYMHLRDYYEIKNRNLQVNASKE